MVYANSLLYFIFRVENINRLTYYYPNIIRSVRDLNMK